MAKNRRIRSSGSRNSSAKSSTRLCLECLEKRSLLSAIGLPPAPLAVPASPPAVIRDYHPMSGQTLAHVTAANLAELSGAIPALTTVQGFSSAGNALHAQIAGTGQLDDRTPRYDLQRSVDATNAVSLLPDSAIVTQHGLADSGGAVPIEIVPETNHVIALYPSNSAAGTEASSGDAADSTLLSPEMPHSGWSAAHGLAGRRESVDLTDPNSSALTLQPILAAGNAPDDASAANPAGSIYMVFDFQPNFEMAFMGYRGSEGFRWPLYHGYDQAVEANVVNEVSLSLEAAATPLEPPPPPVARIHGPDTSGANDSSRIADQAIAAPEGSASAPNGSTSPLVTSAAVSNSTFADTASNFLESGFIALDDSSPATLQPGIAPPLGKGFKALESNGPDWDGWLSDILPGPGRPAEAVNRGRQNNLAGRNPVGDAASRMPTVNLPVVMAEDGGIELAMDAPSATEAGGDPGQPIDRGAAQPMSDIRPESDVGLFCDIEVAAMPAIPTGNSVSAGTAHQNSGSWLVGTGFRGGNFETTMESVPPLNKRALRTLSGLTDQLPLLFAVTVFISGGGLRLEEESSQQNRRPSSGEDLRQLPK